MAANPLAPTAPRSPRQANGGRPRHVRGTQTSSTSQTHARRGPGPGELVARLARLERMVAVSVLGAQLAYTIAEAARVLSTNRDVVRRLVNEGELEVVELSAQRRVIPRAELERYLAEHQGPRVS